MSKILKQLLIAGMLSIMIASVSAIAIPKASASSCEIQGKLCSFIRSQPQPQPGQTWRSSDNFSTSYCEGELMQWHIQPGDKDEADRISFGVALDRPGSDPTVFYSPSVGDCAVTDLVKDPKMYIGDPKGATEVFAVSTYVSECGDFDHGSQTCDYQDSIPIGQVFQPMSHNTYEPQYASSLAEALDQVKAIEIDIFDSLIGIGCTGSQWYVYHNPGEKNNCSGTGLSDCLKDVRQWHQQNPNHDLVTILIDKKNDWCNGAGRGPQNLDALIRKELSPNNEDIFYEPRDLVAGGSCQAEQPSMRVAAQNNCWENVGDRKGQFMLLLGGSGPVAELPGTPNAMIAEYVQKTSGDRGLLFACPDVNTLDHITGQPEKFDAQTAQSVVCNNFISEEMTSTLGDAVRNNNYMSHIGVLATENDCHYTTGVNSYGISYVGIDDFHQEDWNDGRMRGGYNCD